MTGALSERPVAPDRLRHVEDSLDTIREALLTLRYGSVAITVHEGRITQIDVTEKRRFSSQA